MRSSCDLEVSGISNNLWEVSGTMFLSLNCANLVVAHCFRCNFVFSCARTRAEDGQVCEYARV